MVGRIKYFEQQLWCNELLDIQIQIKYKMVHTCKNKLWYLLLNVPLSSFVLNVK